MIPVANMRVVLGALAVIVLFAMFVPSNRSLSLATDVGMTDQEACSLVQEHALDATQKLDASGFPRATRNNVETYRLQREGVTEQVIRVDWSRHMAECLPLDTAVPISVNVDMKSNAYNILVGELRGVIQNGHLSGWNAGNFGTVVWNTRVTTSTGHDQMYRWSLAQWAAGWLTSHGGSA